MGFHRVLGVLRVLTVENFAVSYIIGRGSIQPNASQALKVWEPV